MEQIKDDKSRMDTDLIQNFFRNPLLRFALERGFPDPAPLLRFHLSNLKDLSMPRLSSIYMFKKSIFYLQQQRIPLASLSPAKGPASFSLVDFIYLIVHENPEID